MYHAFCLSEFDEKEESNCAGAEDLRTMATGLPLPLYTQPPTGVDLRYNVPYITTFPSCALNVNTMTLSQWNYYNSLLANAASQNVMASMLRMTSNNTRLSPQSRDSGIYSDPAISPQGSLDLSMTPNRNKGIMALLFTEHGVARNSHVLRWNFSIARATSYSVISQTTVRLVKFLMIMHIWFIFHTIYLIT